MFIGPQGLTNNAAHFGHHLLAHCAFAVSINRCFFLDSILHISLSKQGAIGVGIAKAKRRRKGTVFSAPTRGGNNYVTKGKGRVGNDRDSNSIYSVTYLQNVPKRKVLSEDKTSR